MEKDRGIVPERGVKRGRATVQVRGGEREKDKERNTDR